MLYRVLGGKKKIPILNSWKNPRGFFRRFFSFYNLRKTSCR